MKRSFIIGDEWLYYKIYCGEKTADHLLTEAIEPMIKSLELKELIDRWFFIRYTDPHFHLRLRFHLKKRSFLGKVVEEVQNKISPYFEQDLIWKVQTDTYQRELERYGKTTVGEAEEFFHSDSQVCLKALTLIEDEKLLFFFVLRSIDQLLTVFKFSLEEKVLFSKRNLDAFKKEFRSDRLMNKQLLKKYQKLEKEGISFLTLTKHEEYDPLLQLLTKKEIALHKIAIQVLQKKETNQLEMPLSDLLASFIHLMVNRYFRGNQRLFELLCYHFLNKVYLQRSI